jgi:hypothetical protein
VTLPSGCTTGLMAGAGTRGTGEVGRTGAATVWAVRAGAVKAGMASRIAAKTNVRPVIT